MKEPRRYLLGLEPIFEGGWLHKGRRARDWNVEKELVAISLLGDVTIDLTNVKSLPSEIRINAYAIGRDCSTGNARRNGWSGQQWSPE